MRDLRWIEGRGLYAVTELTERARAQIAAHEYLYFSPVFEYSKATGTVQAIHMGALTNNPAITGMDPLSLCAAATAAFIDPAPQPSPQEPLVNPLLKAVLAALGLPDNTTEDAACSALSAMGSIKSLKDKAAAACTALALPVDATADAVIAACTSLRTPITPDPAKFVPLAVVDDLRTSLAALTARQHQADLDALIAPALADGRLLPVQEAWARDLGKTNIAALTAYIKTAQPIPALSGSQTHGVPPSGTAAAGALSPAELAVCSAMGLTAEQYKSAAVAA